MLTRYINVQSSLLRIYFFLSIRGLFRSKMSGSPQLSGRTRGPSPPYNATILAGNGSELLSRCIAARSWWRPTPDGATFNLFWASNGQSFEGIDWHNWRGPPAGQRQLINRIKGNGGITNKDRLCQAMRNYARAAKLDPRSPMLPLSFIIRPAGEGELTADLELSAFRDAAAAAKKRGETMWIVKPAALNRGRGIHVFDSPKRVEAFLKTKSEKNLWVVQKYIENPLLVNGRKFDIRLWVLVTSDKRVYMYRDSYIRTSGVAYDPKNIADKAIHLVNDAVQAQFESYGAFEDANKLSFAEFQAILDAQPLADGRTLKVEEDIWPQMRTTVQHVFSCALSQHFSPAPPGGGMFELFGLDFMLDAEGHALLIEVGASPRLALPPLAFHVLALTVPTLVVTSGLPCASIAFHVLALAVPTLVVTSNPSSLSLVRTTLHRSTLSPHLAGMATYSRYSSPRSSRRHYKRPSTLSSLHHWMRHFRNRLTVTS